MLCAKMIRVTSVARARHRVAEQDRLAFPKVFTLASNVKQVLAPEMAPDVNLRINVNINFVTVAYLG